VWRLRLASVFAVVNGVAICREDAPQQKDLVEYEKPGLQSIEFDRDKETVNFSFKCA